MAATRDYVFGYTDDEHRRLISQSRIFGDLTEEMFRRAELQSGMSVLDVGCGAGDVSFLAADLVGPGGTVLGVDRSAKSIAIAQERARALHLEGVTFRQGELDTLQLDQEYDALVGRLVLMYLPQPVRVLSHLLNFVRSGGLAMFQEIEMSMARAVPYSAIYETCRDWIRETVRRAGFETDMGSRLFATFCEGGLSEPKMILHARVEGGAGSSGYEYVAETIRSLLPMMERLGVATPDEVQVDTLSSRLETEISTGGGVMILPALIGAWARKPG